MALEQEIVFFDQNKADWLQHHLGKFAVIRTNELAGFYDNAAGAYVAGVDRWGDSPFLIRQVCDEEPIEHIPALTYGLIHAGP